MNERLKMLDEVAKHSPAERVRYLLKANGFVVAGGNTVKGCILRANIATLLKTERGGELTSRLGTHGGPVFRAVQS